MQMDEGKLAASIDGLIGVINSGSIADGTSVKRQLRMSVDFFKNPTRWRLFEPYALCERGLRY